MNPWKKYKKDLTYIQRKYESVKDNSDLTLNEYDSIMTDNEENINRKDSNEILQFSKWVHKKNSDVIIDNSYESHSLPSNSFEFEEDKRKLPSRNIFSTRARKNPPDSPVKVTKEEFDDWLQPKSGILLDDTIDDGMKESSDLLTRISNLERHLCELIQVNRALIESRDPGEGIPMPQLYGNYDSSVVVRKPSPPWKRNCSNRVNLKIPLSKESQNYCSEIYFVPSSPVKENGFLSRDCNGVYFSPKSNPTKKMLITNTNNNSFEPDLTNINNSKPNNSSYKSVQTSFIPRRLFS